MPIPSTATIDCLNTENRANFFYPNDGFVDMLLRKISFQPMVNSTTQFDFSQASAIPATGFFERDALLPNNPANVVCSANVFRRVGDNVSMSLMEQISSRGRCDSPVDFDQLEQQARGTKLGILRKLSSQLVVGNGVSPNLIGFSRQVTLGHGVSLNASAPLVLQDLYKAAGRCRGTNNSIGTYGGRYFVSNEEAFRQVFFLLDNAGRTPKWIFDYDLNSYLAVICGLPWLIDNSIPTRMGPIDQTSIYVVQLKGYSAVRILYSEDPNNVHDRWGIAVYDIPLQVRSNNLLQCVVGFYSLHVPEDKVIVELKNVQLNNIA
jgi:hypothetical protein